MPTTWSTRHSTIAPGDLVDAFIALPPLHSPSTDRTNITVLHPCHHSYIQWISDWLLRFCLYGQKI